MDNIEGNMDVPPIPSSEIFSNELILESIFKGLKVRDLKQCRGVNMMWCREATTTLVKNHKLIPINTGEEQKNNIYFYLYNQEYEWKSVEMNAVDFMTMVSASISFPCNSIGLRISILKNKTVQSFLNSYGENIKELEIEIDSYMLKGPVVKVIENLLTQQVTKLQCLTIQEGWISTSTEFLNTVKLKHLTKLLIGKMSTYESNEFIARILNAAVNLKIVGCVCLGSYIPFLRAIVGFGKVHLLDRCKFFITSTLNIEEQIEVYKAVINSKPKLKRISPYWISVPQEYEPQWALIILKCLELNSENLVKIRDFDDFLRLLGNRIPRLAKVEEIYSSMNYLNLLEGNLLKLSFVETFPNLKYITLYNERVSGNNAIDNLVASSLLENVVPCLSVTNFENCDDEFYPNPLPPIMYEYFWKKFPNLTHLKCGTISEFLEVSQHIWRKLTHLRSLDILIEPNAASVEDSYPGLESAFTGFSFENCLRLKDCTTEGRDVNVEIPNLEELRLNPSILNLKNLTSLKLTFNIVARSSRWLNWTAMSPLLTAVTGRFVFALCPILRVSIEIWKSEDYGWSNEFNPFVELKPFVDKFKVQIK